MRQELWGEASPVTWPVLLCTVALGAAIGASATLPNTAEGASNSNSVVREQVETKTAPVATPVQSTVVSPQTALQPATAQQPTAPPAPASAALSAAADPGKPQVCEPFIIEFKPAEVAPSTEVAARLRKLAEFLVAHPNDVVVIDGHADSFGSEELNLRLSKRRADAIAWVLVSSGVDKTRVTARGFGAFSPVEGSSEDADENRRAVVHVKGDCPEMKEIVR
ncbi:MAG: OmpA family protein [Polyangiaceae bacterium]